jgi:hypothetical protein
MHLCKRCFKTEWDGAATGMRQALYADRLPPEPEGSGSFATCPQAAKPINAQWLSGHATQTGRQ